MLPGPTATLVVAGGLVSENSEIELNEEPTESPLAVNGPLDP